MAAQLSATLAEPEPELKAEDLDVADLDVANQESSKPAQALVASVV